MYQTIARGISLLFLHVQAAAPVLTRCDMRDYAEAAVEVSDIIEAAAPRDLRYAHVAAAEIVHCKLYPLAGDIRPDGYAVEAFENVREIATAHSGVAGYLIKAQLIENDLAFLYSWGDGLAHGLGLLHDLLEHEVRFRRLLRR